MGGSGHPLQHKVPMSPRADLEVAAQGLGDDQLHPLHLLRENLCRRGGLSGDTAATPMSPAATPGATCCHPPGAPAVLPPLPDPPSSPQYQPVPQRHREPLKLLGPPGVSPGPIDPRFRCPPSPNVPRSQCPPVPMSCSPGVPLVLMSPCPVAPPGSDVPQPRCPPGPDVPRSRCPLVPVSPRSRCPLVWMSPSPGVPPAPVSRRSPRPHLCIAGAARRSCRGCRAAPPGAGPARRGPARCPWPGPALWPPAPPGPAARRHHGPGRRRRKRLRGAAPARGRRHVGCGQRSAPIG